MRAHKSVTTAASVGLSRREAEMRSCRACNAVLDESEFNKHWNKIYGLYYFDLECRWCVSEKRHGKRKSNNKYRLQPAEQIRARGIVKRAVRRGHLIKPDRCSQCSLSASSRNIHAHHHAGYDKPLEIVWLCRWCHEKFHMKAA